MNPGITEDRHPCGQTFHEEAQAQGFADTPSTRAQAREHTHTHARAHTEGCEPLGRACPFHRPTMMSGVQLVLNKYV